MTTTSRPMGAFHLAHLNPMTGVGLLVLPKVSDNVWLGPESINGSDWNVAVRELSVSGWDLLTDEFDLPLSEGRTSDGREVIGLIAREPITSEPATGEVIATTLELRALVFGAPAQPTA